MIVRSHTGFTLIELLVALAIAGILLVLAFPNYILWMAEANVRNAASSVADGLRFAQGEAVKRNRNVEFVMGAAGWTVQMVGGVDIRTSRFTEGTKNATFTPTPAGRTTVTFNALGQVETANALPNPPLPFTGINLTSPTVTKVLRVQVGSVTQPNSARIKICDPDFIWPDPKGCPP